MGKCRSEFILFKFRKINLLQLEDVVSIDGKVRVKWIR